MAVSYRLHLMLHAAAAERDGFNNFAAALRCELRDELRTAKDDAVLRTGGADGETRRGSGLQPRLFVTFPPAQAPGPTATRNAGAETPAL